MTVKLSVRLTPRAGRSEIGALGDDDVLSVRVSEPPVDGRANTALCRLLAKRLGVAPSRVTVVRGERSRIKVVEVDGLGQEELDARLRG